MTNTEFNSRIMGIIAELKAARDDFEHEGPASASDHLRIARDSLIRLELVLLVNSPEPRTPGFA